MTEKGTGIRKIVITFVLAAVLLPLSDRVRAENLVGKPTSGLFGLKVGLIGRMNLSSEPPLQSEIGSSCQVFAHMPVRGALRWSGAFDFYYIQLVNSNQVMIEPSIGLNYSLNLRRSGMAVVPGVAVGFAFLADMGTLPSSEYFTLKLSTELHGIINARTAWIGELGMFYAPDGHNRNEHFTFGPGLIVRVGLAFR